MKSDVFFASAAPTARKKDDNSHTLEAQIKAGLDASLAKHAGQKVVAVNVTADIISNFQKALVTVVYDDAKPEAPKPEAHKK